MCTGLISQVSRKLVFLEAFEKAIDTDFGNHYPRTVVVLVNPEKFFQPLSFSKFVLILSKF